MDPEELLTQIEDGLFPEEKDNVDKPANEVVETTTGTEAPEKSAKEVSPTAGTGEEATPRADGPQAPNTWTKEAAAKWASIDPDIQAEILRREKNIHEGLDQYKTRASLGDSFQQVFEPYAAQMKELNLDPVQLTRNFAQAHYTLATGTPEQKLELIQYLAKSYGIPLTPEEDAPYVDPTVLEMQKELQSLRQEVLGKKAQEQSQQQKQILTQIETFVNDPAHPHASILLDDMAKLIQAGIANDLADAYDKAVYANPTVRAQELVRLQTEAANKAKTEQEAEAAKLKKAAEVNLQTSAKNSRGGKASFAQTLEETIAESLAEIQSRA